LKIAIVYFKALSPTALEKDFLKTGQKYIRWLIFKRCLQQPLKILSAVGDKTKKFFERNR
jgi:hypothetical protein